MKLRFVSDYVCPYCYVAKKPVAEVCRERGIEIEWVPFELSRPPKPQVDTYNDPVRREKYAKTLVPICEEQGITMAIPPKVIPRPYTSKAFEGWHYACAHGKSDTFNDAVYEAYFTDEKDIGDINVLCELAASVGMDEDDFRRALITDEYAEIQRAAAEYSRNDLDVRGVPTLFLDGIKLEGSALTRGDFEQLLNDFIATRASSNDVSPVCGDDGCVFTGCDENGCGNSPE